MRLGHGCLAQLHVRYSILPFEFIGRQIYRRKQLYDRRCPFCRNDADDEIHYFLLTSSTYRDLMKDMAKYFPEISTSSDLEVRKFLVNRKP